MKILKFGGTSVGSAENIRLVHQIAKKYIQDEVSIALVVSAQSGVTNLLESAGKKAAEADESYQADFEQIEKKLFGIMKELIEVNRQSKLFANTKLMLNNLEDVLHGIFLLREFSPRIRDLVLSFGERFSAQIISTFFNQEDLESEMLDAHQIIRTNSDFGSAKVDFPLTNDLIVGLFCQASEIANRNRFCGFQQPKPTNYIGAWRF